MTARDIGRLAAVMLAAGMLVAAAACGAGREEGTDMSETTTAVTAAAIEAPISLPEARTGADGYDGATDLLCGIDQFGRVIEPVSAMREDVDVGMFYFLWHGGPVGGTGQTTWDISKLLQQNPDALWNAAGAKESPLNDFHYWGEPLYGYYKSSDKWVIRRHIEMLVQAGIDFLIFDTTNAFIYESACNAVLSVLDDMREEGADVPQVTFYTNSYSQRTITKLYETIYKPGRYRELWYAPQGKPMIIGITDPARDRAEIGDASYQPSLSDEVKAFFDIRESQWPNKSYREDGFPWMEWSYPQPLHSGVVNVSVAQHPQLPFSDSILDPTRNRGRGYNVATGKNESDRMRMGLNFESQWEAVLSRRDEIDTVFVTGWNEWTAQKLVMGGRVWFVDCASEEFSRDIEPMRGGYEDAFYLQLVRNVRALKGEGEVIASPVRKQIDLHDLSDWDEVTNLYRAVSQEAVTRRAMSVDGKYDYFRKPPRNNIQSVKVTHDATTLYFLISCEEEIVGEGENFMNILLGVGEVRAEGWEGYQFAVNRESGKLCRLDGAGNATAVADVETVSHGASLAVGIPLDALGTDASGLGVYFKVADGVEDVRDIMETYVSGKCLPMGRLSYYYYF